MPSLINSDDGVVSGSAGIKTTGSNDGILALQNNGTTNVTVTAAGNVGIGTSSPQSVLHVSYSGESGLRLSNINGTPSDWTMQTLNSGILRLYSYTAGTERMRIDSSGNFQFNSGYGSVATAYGCRAWVNFNGTGTVAIRASGNVTSITDNGTGDYTVNFTTAMPDANYAVAGSGVDSAGGAVSLETYSTGTILVGSVRVLIRNSGVGVQDNALVSVAIFR